MKSPLPKVLHPVAGRTMLGHVLATARALGPARLVVVTRPDADEIAGFVRAVGIVARDKGLVEPGYRMMANIGAHGGQEVPHLHVHLFGGEPLGPMIWKRG